jgi:hypothetical protein
MAAPVPAGASIDVVPNFAADGTFGLSLWFQRGWCDRVVDAQDATLLSWPGIGAASVNIQVWITRGPVHVCYFTSPLAALRFLLSKEYK